MSTKGLQAKVAELKELQQMAEELEQEAETLKDVIKAEMMAKGTEEMAAGTFKVRWTTVKSARLDTISFKQKYQDLLPNSQKKRLHAVSVLHKEVYMLKLRNNRKPDKWEPFLEFVYGKMKVQRIEKPALADLMRVGKTTLYDRFKNPHKFQQCELSSMARCLSIPWPEIRDKIPN